MSLCLVNPALFTKDDHAWLSGFNRTVLQQTEDGRSRLKAFDGVEGGKPAPLLMDGRKDTVAGAIGANKINVMKLERMSAERKKPILPLRAYHDKPKSGDGAQTKADQMSGTCHPTHDHTQATCRRYTTHHRSVTDTQQANTESTP